MKKLIALLLALVMCLSLVACGGDTTDPNAPVIDAFNAASDAFATTANAINEDIEAYPQDLVDELNELVDIMNANVDLLASDEEMTQEDLDAIVEFSAEVEAWAAETKPLIEEYAATAVDTQPAKDAYVSAENAYNEILTYVNENPELFTQEDIAAVTEIGESLDLCKEALETTPVTDQEALDALIVSLVDMENWAVSVKEALGI